jgi:hypothetical protein
MKKFIDWLFWKRIWFRMLFVLIPTWMIPVIIISIKYGWVTWLGVWNFRILLILLYLLFLSLAIIDNKKIKV